MIVQTRQAFGASWTCAKQSCPQAPLSGQREHSLNRRCSFPTVASSAAFPAATRTAAGRWVSGHETTCGRGRLYENKSFGAPYEATKTALLFKWIPKAIWKPFGTVGCSAGSTNGSTESHSQLAQACTAHCVRFIDGSPRNLVQIRPWWSADPLDRRTRVGPGPYRLSRRGHRAPLSPFSPFLQVKFRAYA
jgi:hypothetical protein